LEASGTSGMKSALNGGLNLSIRDGWWDEWYDGENGWEIPTADGLADEGRRDDLEAGALYDLLENVVIPTFYERNEHGVPTRRVEMVRHNCGCSARRFWPRGWCETTPRSTTCRPHNHCTKSSSPPPANR
jgi:glucan phosphorylase